MVQGSAFHQTAPCANCAVIQHVLAWSLRQLAPPPSP